MRSNLLFLLLIFIAASASAFTLDTPLANPGQEAHAKTLFAEFRCVVCQSESVADSPAEVAGTIRSSIRHMVAAGATDEEIRAALVSRYGSFVLMSPPLSPYTYLLWLGPFLLLIIGGFVLTRYFHTHRNMKP